MGRRKSCRIAVKTSLNRFIGYKKNPIMLQGCSDDDFVQAPVENTNKDTNANIALPDSKGLKEKRRKNNDLNQSHVVESQKRKRSAKKPTYKPSSTAVKKTKKCEGKTFPLLRARTTPRPFYQAIHNMNKEKQDCVNEMGFEKMLNFNVHGIPPKLGYYIVDVFDPDAMVLRLENHCLPISIELIHAIFGVPMGGQPVDTRDKSMQEDDVKNDWISKYGHKNITANDIMENMDSTRKVDWLFRVDFIMLFCTTMIHCNSSGVCNKKLLKCFSKTTCFKDLDWCGYIYKNLKTCKTGWRRSDTNCPFTGPLTLLTLVYLDGTRCNNIKVNKMQSSINVWNIAKMRLREEAELKSGGFGIGELVIKDDTNKQPTVNEYKTMLIKMHENLVSDRENFIEIICKAKSIYPDNEAWSEFNLMFNNLFTIVQQKSKEATHVSEDSSMHTPKATTNGKSTKSCKENISNYKEVDKNEKDILEMSPLSDFWNDVEIMDELEETMQSSMSASQLKQKRRTSPTPSFSLGLTQLFEDLANINNENDVSNASNEDDMETLDHIPLSERIKLIPSKPPSNTKKRPLTKADKLRSPYENRVVDIKRGLSKDEDKVWYYLFRPMENQQELAYATKVGYEVYRETFESFAPHCWIMVGIIDCWSALLNHEEKSSKKYSNHRLFCTTSVMSDGMLHDKGMTEETKLSLFRDNLMQILDCQADMLSLSTFDLVFFPVLEHNHYYLICFDLKKPTMVIIDNISQVEPETIGPVNNPGSNRHTIVSVPCQYRSIFGKYLQLVGHPKSSQILAGHPIRMPLKWSTTKNNNDCGIFLMRHMESYNGLAGTMWDCGFEPEGRKQKTQILHLRRKYAAKLLLSELNYHKEEVLHDATNIAKEMEKLKKIEKANKSKSNKNKGGKKNTKKSKK